eukprot:jgi/Mesvir1/24304/Mv10992-RA.3
MVLLQLSVGCASRLAAMASGAEMEETGNKKKKKEKGEVKEKPDIEALKSEVANFASSLGLGGLSGSGFDDSDFRTRPEKKAVEPKGEKKSSSKTKGKDDDKSEAKVKKRSKDDSGKEKKEKSAKESKAASVAASTKQPDKSPQTKRPALPSQNAAFKVSSKTAPTPPLTTTTLPEGAWYDTLATLTTPGENAPAARPVSEDEKRRMREVAEQIFSRHAEMSEAPRGKGGKDMEWLRAIRSSGTSSDKVAALTVLIQEDPVANLKSLDSLLGLVSNKGGKRQAVTAIDAIKELFTSCLLPDRKLRFFEDQPALYLHADAVTAEGGNNSSSGGGGKGRGAHRLRDQCLELWYFEDCIKGRYEGFVLSLEALTKDPLEFIKEKAVKAVYELLVGKPEQEAKLLSILVNKLGDPDRKAASTAVFLLQCLLTAHPQMKAVVVREVHKFVFRPGVGMRACYYCMVFLNQIILSTKDNGPAVAKSLIDIYFQLFKAITAGELTDAKRTGPSSKKGDNSTGWNKDRRGAYGSNNKYGSYGGKGGKGGKGGHGDGDAQPFVELDSRLLSALLTGINRAFPYVSADAIEPLIEAHAPALFRMVHVGSFSGSLQALLLLYNLMSLHQASSDRFYRALYSVLLSDQLPRTSKTATLLSLLFKAMRDDVNAKRVAAFAKRVLQVAAHQPPPFACGALLMLSQVLKHHPGLWNAILQPEEEGDGVEHFVDVGEEGEEGVGGGGGQGSGDGVKESTAHGPKEVEGHGVDEGEDGDLGDLRMAREQRGRRGKRTRQWARRPGMPRNGEGRRRSMKRRRRMAMRKGRRWRWKWRGGKIATMMKMRTRTRRRRRRRRRRSATRRAGRRASPARKGRRKELGPRMGAASRKARESAQAKKDAVSAQARGRRGQRGQRPEGRKIVMMSAMRRWEPLATRGVPGTARWAGMTGPRMATGQRGGGGQGRAGQRDRGRWRVGTTRRSVSRCIAARRQRAGGSWPRLRRTRTPRWRRWHARSWRGRRWSTQATP